MAQTRSVVLHERGPALWPEHKPLKEVLDLKETTQELVWSGTYQGVPTPPGGYTYKRAWWRNTRYALHDHMRVPRDWIYARYQSWDTALKDEEGNAFTAMVQGDLMMDYTLRISYVWRARPEFDTLPDEITARATSGNYDGKLRNIIIEDKASGISAIQTLRASVLTIGLERKPLAPMIVAFNAPGLDKQQRAEQAAVWCRNGSVWLPHPDMTANPWLPDYEEELFTFPQAQYKDWADATSQLIMYLENILASGYEARADAGYRKASEG